MRKRRIGGREEWNDLFIASTQPIDMREYTSLNVDCTFVIGSSSSYSTVFASTMKIGVADSRSANQTFTKFRSFTSPNTQGGILNVTGTQTIDITNNNLSNGYFKCSFTTSGWMEQRTDGTITKIWLSK